jgi:hypothetical protein
MEAQMLPSVARRAKACTSRQRLHANGFRRVEELATCEPLGVRVLDVQDRAAYTYSKVDRFKASRDTHMMRPSLELFNSSGILFVERS